MTCYNKYNYPEATANIYWKSVSTGLPPYPTVTSDFYLNLFRTDPGGKTVDVGFDSDSYVGNAGSVTLQAQAMSNSSGTYRGLSQISTNSQPKPAYAQEFVVCR